MTDIAVLVATRPWRPTREPPSATQEQPTAIHPARPTGHEVGNEVGLERGLEM